MQPSVTIISFVSLCLFTLATKTAATKGLKAALQVCLVLLFVSQLNWTWLDWMLKLQTSAIWFRLFWGLYSRSRSLQNDGAFAAEASATNLTYEISQQITKLTWNSPIRLICNTVVTEKQQNRKMKFQAGSETNKDKDKAWQQNNRDEQDRQKRSQVKKQTRRETGREREREREVEWELKKGWHSGKVQFECLAEALATEALVRWSAGREVGTGAEEARPVSILRKHNKWPDWPPWISETELMEMVLHLRPTTLQMPSSTKCSPGGVQVSMTMICWQGIAIYVSATIL